MLLIFYRSSRWPVRAARLCLIVIAVVFDVGSFDFVFSNHYVEVGLILFFWYSFTFS